MAAFCPPSERRERVLVLTTSYPRHKGDAAGHFVMAEVEELRRRGHEVTVAAAGGPFEDRTVVDLGGAALFAHPGALPRLLERKTRALELISSTRKARALARERYDRVLCHWLVPTAYLWGSAFANSRGARVCVAHGSDVRVLLRLPALARHHVLRSLLRSRFELRFVSEELKGALLSRDLPHDLRQFVQQAEVRPSPIDCASVLGKADARRELGLKENDRWAVIVGRLISGKRPEVALASASLVPGLKAAVIGSGPLAEELKEKYPDFRFLGQLPRDETLRWISAADVLIAASRLEGAPTVIREARALETPVVSVAAGDLAKWAQHDNELWVVDGDLSPRGAVSVP